jgi:hypothetical protein
MRSIQLFGKKETSWQILPADAPDFEESARRACALVLARDPRIGKVPRSRAVAKRGDTPPGTPGAGRRSRKGKRAAP